MNSVLQMLFMVPMIQARYSAAEIFESAPADPAFDFPSQVGAHRPCFAAHPRCLKSGHSQHRLVDVFELRARARLSSLGRPKHPTCTKLNLPQAAQLVTGAYLMNKYIVSI